MTAPTTERAKAQNPRSLSGLLPFLRPYRLRIGLATGKGLAYALGVPLWIGNTVRQVWNFAGKQDGMQRDMTELVRSIEDWAEGGASKKA